MSRRFVINITTSANWRERPVGIVRVEREIIKAAYGRLGKELVPTYLDYPTGRLLTVDQHLFRQIMSDDWVDGSETGSKTVNIHRYLKPFTPSANDKVISVGSDWSFEVPDKIEALYGSKRVLISACYDLIPLLYPEFTPGPEFFDQFNHHYRALARLAHGVFAISEVSAQSLRDFWADEGLTSTAPPVTVVPLAAPVPAAEPTKLDATEQSVLEEIEKAGPYVIYVSTIEPRKNHQLLLDIWRDLYAERGENCPTLLLVGMKGWGSGDLLRSAERMAVSKAGKIQWRKGISDALLMALYQRSAFAVFPSYFEGWGLAATEAAALGRVCVVSKTGALIEATQGKMPSYHPLDFLGWKGEIVRLLDDLPYRSALEARLEDGHFKRTWADFADDFCTHFLVA
ncbi:glycosyltransferase [Sphingomonas sp. KRR8]|uniref:glycosyltransferase n=1 Tax=Sphingomonas sp. KRR8 TaxID=2942996 RepID=UPI00202072D1|nr:glycosyltransferase [Sphingomonas sp. KRR8]URD61959.1 glycosyltransferase [Sphingomonas sp. KRR8]